MVFPFILLWQNFPRLNNFTINNIKVNIASYSVKDGDIIKIRANKRNKKTFVGLTEKVKHAKVPGWLHYDASEDQAKVLHAPKKEDFDQTINSQAIVEFYSK